MQWEKLYNKILEAHCLMEIKVWKATQAPENYKMDDTSDDHSVIKSRTGYVVQCLVFLFGKNKATWHP